ncbi:MAG: hypothetical protein ACI8ZB_004848 [Desulforhopalus sp.]|jgi:hypothetical protein
MVESTTTELLIVKAGGDYIRFTEGGFERCVMGKGSVFSLSQVDEVKKKCTEIAGDVAGLQLMKLSISEEPFVE